MNMTRDDINKLSFTELRHLLITPDYKGKTVKEIALEILLERKYDEGFICGEANERGST